MKLRVSNQKTAALTLTEVLLVIVVLFVLVALLLPVTSHRALPPRSQCVNNLKQINLAYYVWGLDHNGKFPMQVSVADGGTMELTADGRNAWFNFLVMSNELSTPRNLYCPADTDHVLAINWTSGFSAANVSYFVGLDADTNHPQMFLSGDDNFAVGGVPVKSELLQLSPNTPISWTAARHHFSGEIAFTDGSVQPSSNSDLTNCLKKIGVVTNRLAIP